MINSVIVSVLMSLMRQGYITHVKEAERDNGVY